MRRPRVQIILDDEPLSLSVQEAIRGLDAEFRVELLGAESAADPGRTPDVLLIVTENAATTIDQKLDTLAARLAQHHCPTLILGRTSTGDERLPTALTSICPVESAAHLSGESLTARLRTLLGARRSGGEVEREMGLLRQADASHVEDLRRLDDELRQAGALLGNLQTRVPRLAGADLHVLARPAGRLSGDMYDIHRLDESRIGIALCDATGHDLSAALLSLFVRRSLRGDATPSAGGHRLDVDDVLRKTNAALIEAGLDECQFVSALYAVYDERTRVLRWARAGAPYPVLLGVAGAPDPVISDGPLLGVIESPRFEVRERLLSPGDTVLFHTDGFDEAGPMFTPNAGRSDGAAHPWLRPLGERTIQSRLAEIDADIAEIDRGNMERDDVTVVVIQVHALGQKLRRRDASPVGHTVTW